MRQRRPDRDCPWRRSPRRRISGNPSPEGYQSYLYLRKTLADNRGMRQLVLLRHGESAWNKENRFTGWTDVDLTEQGIAEAKSAGRVLKEKGFVFDVAHTS